MKGYLQLSLRNRGWKTKLSVLLEPRKWNSFSVPRVGFCFPFESMWWQLLLRVLCKSPASSQFEFDCMNCSRRARHSGLDVESSSLNTKRKWVLFLATEWAMMCSCSSRLKRHISKPHNGHLILFFSAGEILAQGSMETVISSTTQQFMIGAG